MTVLPLQECPAMLKKRLLCPHRLRRVPEQFSWIDQRLVRDKHIGRVSHPALALYLFLLTVADAQGLSYYSDTSIGSALHMDLDTLQRARRELITADLMIYQSPLYQILALDPPRTPLQQPRALGDILRAITEKNP
jgi:hypothetical protein